MIHGLKTWPEPFAAIVRGDKTHEARKNDRGYAVGDVLRLREWVPDVPEHCNWQASGGSLTGTFTGASVDVIVTYITPGGAYGLPADLCVMSIKRVE